MVEHPSSPTVAMSGFAPLPMLVLFNKLFARFECVGIVAMVTVTVIVITFDGLTADMACVFEFRNLFIELSDLLLYLE